jgi:hypothetical protein
MGLKQADSASILRTPVGEIIWHAFSPLEATRGRVGKFPVLPLVALTPFRRRFRLIATTFSLGFTAPKSDRTVIIEIGPGLA